MGLKVAIVGGGPGGLMTAYQLQQRCAAGVETTIYEASGRLGGKVLTECFATAPVAYEAGAAELYDYSHVGEDPLRALVERLGLQVKPMQGAAVVLDGKVIAELNDVGRVLGESAGRAIAEFDRRAHRWCSPEEYYESDWKDVNADPMMQRTFEEELARLGDEDARRYLRVLVHSDLATEPRRTNAAYGLQNYLMNDERYLRLYTIEGGLEQMLRGLAARVTAEIRLGERVTEIRAGAGEGMRVCSVRGGVERRERYDFVVAALPHNYLLGVRWAGEGLDAAMRRHHAHYDYPAHYLRVSVLFGSAFWREQLTESYVMLEAFGGCCLYDESARTACGEYGVLGWLLAGEAATTACNWSDEELVERVLDALPSGLQHGRGLMLEARVHRWIGSVNGLPGGVPAEAMERRHVPDSEQRRLMVVGDYLFDSTLNGVLDSADFVAETIAEEAARMGAASTTSGIVHA